MTRPPEDTGAAVPPYEGRKESADSDDQTDDQGVRTGGASAATSDDDMTSPDPAHTPGGATASPADKPQDVPEDEVAETDPGTSGTAHTPGTGRAEDAPKD